MSTVKLSHVQKLGDENYQEWATDMKWLLVTRDCWDAISDPEEADDATQLKALALIGLCVSIQHKAPVAACDTAKEAWDLLEGVYKAKSNALRVRLRKELSNLELKPCWSDASGEKFKTGFEPMTAFVARARSLRDRLLAAGHEVEEGDVVLNVLAGLPDDYESATSVLLHSNEQYTLETILPQLLIAEERVAARVKGERGMAVMHARGLVASSKEGEGPVCWECNEKGHIRRDCPELEKKMRKKKAVQRRAVALSAIAL